MTMENSEEYKINKPESLYEEERLTEATPEAIEENIETETQQLESKQEILKTNLAELGGEEGAQKVWSEMGEEEKKEILEKINQFSQKRKSAIDDQEFALSLMNPVSHYKSMREDSGVVISGLFSATMTLAGPMLAVVEGLPATFDRVKNSIKLNKEKRKLANLENRYQ